MAELVLDFGAILVDDASLVRGFGALGWSVVGRGAEPIAVPGRFDGIVGMFLRSADFVRPLLEAVRDCRPEWFLLDECGDVSLDGYGVQRLTVNGRSLQFGHRSGWVIDVGQEATPESVAAAVAKRRPAETPEESAGAGAGDRSPRKLVTLDPEPANGFSGGKGGAGVWQAIVNQMPPHDVYVEGCLGRGAVLRHKRPAEMSIGVESDGDVIRAHWTGFDGVPGLRVIEADVKSWLKRSFGVGQVPGRSACLFCGAQRMTPAATRNAAAGSSQPCRQCGQRVLVYVDPPYLAETRKTNGRLYRHEWTRADHVELLKLLLSLPCDVLVSGYDSVLYRSMLKSWRVVTFPAVTRGGSTAVEHLWCNFAEPARLHDPRWLGGDRRARERWRRRADSMSRKLLDLSPRERQAVLERVKREGGLVDV